MNQCTTTTGGGHVPCPLCAGCAHFPSAYALTQRLERLHCRLSCPLCPFATADLLELTGHLLGPEHADIKKEENEFDQLTKNKPEELTTQDLDELLNDFSEIIGHQESSPNDKKILVGSSSGFQITDVVEEEPKEKPKPKADKPVKSPPSSKQVQCSLCGWNFDDEDFLHLHQVLMHSKARREAESMAAASSLPLPVASLLSAKRAAHRRNNNGGNGPLSEFPCRSCGQPFPSSSEYSAHLKSAHDDARFVCSNCGKLFKLRGSLLVHQRVVHGPPPGSPSSPSAPQQQQMSNNEAAEGSWPCNVCGKRFSSKYRKEIHESRHKELSTTSTSTAAITSKPPIPSSPKRSSTNNQPHKCNICQEEFGTQAGLILHSVSHIRDNRHAVATPLMPTCPVEEPSGSNPPSPAPFSCKHCGKTFSRDVHLMQHLKAHGTNTTDQPSLMNSGKAWECETCHKTFTTKYFLKKHKRLHTGEMPYVCSLCGRAFTFQQSYHKHMLYHTDEKPYACGQCGRAFKELSTLQNHERIHSGERPFQCETCGKSFRQRVSYLVHRRIHTGVMPYSCDVCSKKFRYKVTQRTHKCQPGSSFSNRPINEIKEEPSAGLPVIPQQIQDELFNLRRNNRFSFLHQNQTVQQEEQSPLGEQLLQQLHISEGSPSATAATAATVGLVSPVVPANSPGFSTMPANNPVVPANSPGFSPMPATSPAFSPMPATSPAFSPMPASPLFSQMSPSLPLSPGGSLLGMPAGLSPGSQSHG